MVLRDEPCARTVPDSLQGYLLDGEGLRSSGWSFALQEDVWPGQPRIRLSVLYEGGTLDPKGAPLSSDGLGGHRESGRRRE